MAATSRKDADRGAGAQLMFDYLIAGAGFSGAVLAERLAAAGKRVFLCDTRPHVGGNAYDHHDRAGILVHKYGPHIFHTNSAAVFQYLSQFTAWRSYEHRVLVAVNGQLLPMPINLDTLNRHYGLNLDAAGMTAYLASVAEPRAHVITAEDSVVSRMGRDLYTTFFRNYTKKQWGVDPSELDASVTARIPIRTNHDDRYFTDTYQAMPLHGFTAMFERMLDHPLITTSLSTDFKEAVRSTRAREVIYTGPIDSYFGYRFGPLPYRSLHFRHETLDVSRHQPVAVVNYPNDHTYSRITEFKHLTGQVHPRTSIVYETPSAEGDPYYPIPCKASAELYKRYAALAQREPHVHFAGRLGTYRYYNMDQVTAQALKLFSTLCLRDGAQGDAEALIA